jgi:hypothetical protein
MFNGVLKATVVKEGISSACQDVSRDTTTRVAFGYDLHAAASVIGRDMG